jgi:hypothetical protein
MAFDCGRRRRPQEHLNKGRRVDDNQ